MSNTVKTLRRYRNDGRPIYDEIMVEHANVDLALPTGFESTEARMAALYGVDLESYQRQAGKSVMLAMHYGMGTTKPPRINWRRHMNNYQRYNMFNKNNGKSARHPINGPFKVVENFDRRRPFKVVNTNGFRVHRGSEHSCKDVCDNLNVAHAKYLMVRPDSAAFNPEEYLTP